MIYNSLLHPNEVYPMRCFASQKPAKSSFGPYKKEGDKIPRVASSTLCLCKAHTADGPEHSLETTSPTVTADADTNTNVYSEVRRGNRYCKALSRFGYNFILEADVINQIPPQALAPNVVEGLARLDTNAVAQEMRE